MPHKQQDSERKWIMALGHGGFGRRSSDGDGEAIILIASGSSSAIFTTADARGGEFGRNILLGLAPFFGSSSISVKGIARKRD